MSALNFSYDETRDILTVEGQQYSGDLFRSWAKDGMPTDQLFRFIRKDDGTFVIGKINSQELANEIPNS